MGLKELGDKSSFDSALADAGSKLVVVDFFAVWCGPCKGLVPQLEKLAANNTNVHFYKVNVEVNEEVSTEYKISAMPTILFFKNGKKVEEIIGANYNKISAMVTKYS